MQKALYRAFAGVYTVGELNQDHADTEGMTEAEGE